MRPRSGVLLQGGFSTAKRTTDSCGIVTQYRNAVTVTGSIGTVQSTDMCHLETPFLTQVKFLGTYEVPKEERKIGVNVAATGPEPARAFHRRQLHRHGRPGPAVARPAPLGPRPEHDRERDIVERRLRLLAVPLSVLNARLFKISAQLDF